MTGEPISVTSTRLPDGTAVAAETTQVWSRRRRPLTWQRALRATGPYWLLLPVLIAIVAILGYPLYQLVVLSFQQYGLAELIQHKGSLGRHRELRVGPPRPGLLAHAAAHGRLHRRERRPDDRDRDVPRPAPRPRQLGDPDPAHGRPRARLVDARRRRGAGLVLDHELPERHPQLRPHAAAPRRLRAPRLVRDDLLEARDGDAPDRLGSAPVRHDHALRRALAGVARAGRGGRDRRRRAAARLPRRHLPDPEADLPHPHRASRSSGTSASSPSRTC